MQLPVTTGAAVRDYPGEGEVKAAAQHAGFCSTTGRTANEGGPHRSSSRERAAGGCCCAYCRLRENSAGLLWVRQLRKRAAKALQGCSAHSSHLPMASASRLVVATTSLVLALMKIWCPSTRDQPLPHGSSRQGAVPGRMAPGTAFWGRSNSLRAMPGCTHEALCRMGTSRADLVRLQGGVQVVAATVELQLHSLLQRLPPHLRGGHPHTA